jgi:hypothetical protein
MSEENTYVGIAIPVDTVELPGTNKDVHYRDRESKVFLSYLKWRMMY